jgi:hypothetical protein
LDRYHDQVTSTVDPPAESPAPPDGPVVRRRDVAVDRLRGVALLLMILGHSMVVYEALHGPEDVIWWTRHTATRFAMPLFMMMAGYLIAKKGHPAWNRMPAIIAAAVVTNVVGHSLPEIGFHAPNVLANFLMAVPFYFVFVRLPIETVLVGFLQAYYLPITWDEWQGYQPGMIMAFLALGVLVRHHPETALMKIGRRLPSSLEVLGRRPLLWYCGHLAVLYVIALFGLAHYD